jgi:hypothetical protein
MEDLVHDRMIDVTEYLLTSTRDLASAILRECMRYRTPEDDYLIRPEDVPVDALDQLTALDQQQPLWGALPGTEN